MNQNRLDILTTVIANDYTVYQAMKSSVYDAYGIARILIIQNNSRFGEDYTNDEVFLATARAYDYWNFEETL